MSMEEMMKAQEEFQKNFALAKEKKLEEEWEAEEKKRKEAFPKEEAERKKQAVEEWEGLFEKMLEENGVKSKGMAKTVNALLKRLFKGEIDPLPYPEDKEYEPAPKKWKEEEQKKSASAGKSSSSSTKKVVKCMKTTNEEDMCYARVLKKVKGEREETSIYPMTPCRCNKRAEKKGGYCLTHLKDMNGKGFINDGDVRLLGIEQFSQRKDNLEELKKWHGEEGKIAQEQFKDNRPDHIKEEFPYAKGKEQGKRKK